MFISHRFIDKIYSMEEKKYWLGFSMFQGIGPAKLQLLIAYFGSAHNAWHASLADLKASKVGGKIPEQFVEFRKHFSIERYEEQLRIKGVHYFTVSEDAYPRQLAAIKKPPFVLYVKGNTEILSFDKLLAIVGTRKVTAYGRQVTEMFTRDLVGAGFVIVSGLALGVDAIAHQITVDEGGKTVAVLGCGVDCCYPRENERLYEEIIEQRGAIVSEYGIGVPPNPGSFPSRNRIISGLSLGVLVTEGAVDSGSLITANDALENNKPVFAVPGPITSSLSKGPYELLQKGGKLVTSAEEIFESLGAQGAKRSQGAKKVVGDTQEEQVVIDLLQEQDLHFDELVRKTNIQSSELGSLLSLMELKGMVMSADGGVFKVRS